MCGIAGVIGSGIDLSRFSTALNLMKHRGPDASSLFNDCNVVLGHLRLSIIDPDVRSNQPFIKNGFVIVFNGEIYNFRELRSELNVEFVTASDTEVVLEAWRHWGVGSLSRLRGMFAFAIYDQVTGQTTLVRDRFGIKPLFFRPSNNQLLFSSELKTIEAICSHSLQVNRTALLASMLYVWVPEEQCVWRGVKKLEAGCYLQIQSDGKFSHGRYWSPEELLQTNDFIDREVDAVSCLNDVLVKSVNAHLISDVPINAFLSGGLDSSLVVAMARKQLDSLDCYTVRFSGDDQRQQGVVDDAYYAERAAKYLGVRLNTIELKPDLATLLPKIVHHLDEPIGDSAAINTYLICDGARKNGVKVLLSGMGADELFGGYRKHLANALAARYRNLPERLRIAVARGLDCLPASNVSSGGQFVRWAKRFSSFANLPEPDAFLRSYTYFSSAQLLDGLSFDGAAELNELMLQHHETFSTARSHGLVDAMCFTDMARFMVSLNLTYTDRASMAASTEVRVPFIDIEVAKAAFSIPGHLKIKGFTQKYILKKVAERWLPKEIIYRPKASFTMPLRAWIKRDLSDMVNDYLLSSQGLLSRDLFKPDFIRRVVEADRTGREDHSQVIWHMLTMEQWFRNHEV